MDPDDSDGGSKPKEVFCLVAVFVFVFVLVVASVYVIC